MSEIKTPKKYKRQLELTERFENMSSEQRQKAMNAMEARIKELNANEKDPAGCCNASCGCLGSILSHLKGSTATKIKKNLNEKELNKLMEEWVACSMVENLDKDEMGM